MIVQAMNVGLTVTLQSHDEVSHLYDSILLHDESSALSFEDYRYQSEVKMHPKKSREGQCNY